MIRLDKFVINRRLRLRAILVDHVVPAFSFVWITLQDSWLIESISILKKDLLLYKFCFYIWSEDVSTKLFFWLGRFRCHDFYSDHHNRLLLDDRSPSDLNFLHAEMEISHCESHFAHQGIGSEFLYGIVSISSGLWKLEGLAYNCQKDQLICFQEQIVKHFTYPMYHRLLIVL